MHNRREYADVAWGADNVHAFCGIEVAVEVSEDKEFAAACADFLHIGFYFVQQAVVRSNHDNGHVLIHQCQRAMFQFTRRIRFGVDIGNLFQLQCAFKGDWEMDAAAQEECAGFLGKFLRPSGDLRLKIENMLNAARKLTQFFDVFTRLFVGNQTALFAQGNGQAEQDNPEQMVVARMGCPLLVALGDQETFIASDVSAVIAFTRRIAYLEDGDIALLNANGIEKLLDKTGAQTERAIKVSELSLASLELGPYSHFMQKEIHEQPRAIADTAEVFLDGGFEPENFGANAREVFDDIHSIKILACGTSYYAALTAKYWLESIAKVPTDVEIASEYRYRDVIADPKQLVITISQSGETLDTMEALKYAQSLGHKHSLSICNVMESALPRESELVLYTRAGAEIGVASTKAFTTQLVVLFGLAVTLGKQRGLVSDEQAREYVEELRQLPGSIQHVLNLEPQIAAWAQKFAKKTSALFLGRGIHFPIALEGALKLKEITYIHAEAYPAGELKHGPLALVDENMPVVVIAPNDSLLDKVKANMQEVGARGGELFVFADLDSNFNATEGVHVIRAPRHVGVLSPIVHTIPVQLLSYHAALARGTDVDKPRNLAKSVTVE